jgi:hypothetical protein
VKRKICSYPESKTGDLSPYGNLQWVFTLLCLPKKFRHIPCFLYHILFLQRNWILLPKLVFNSSSYFSNHVKY